MNVSLAGTALGVYLPGIFPDAVPSPAGQCCAHCAHPAAVPAVQQLHRADTGAAEPSLGSLCKLPALQHPGEGMGMAASPQRESFVSIVTKQKFPAGNAGSYLCRLFTCSFPTAASGIAVRV